MLLYKDFRLLQTWLCLNEAPRLLVQETLFRLIYYHVTIHMAMMMIHHHLHVHPDRL